MNTKTSSTDTEKGAVGKFLQNVETWLWNNRHLVHKSVNTAIATALIYRMCTESLPVDSKLEIMPDMLIHLAQALISKDTHFLMRLGLISLDAYRIVNCAVHFSIRDLSFSGFALRFLDSTVHTANSLLRLEGLIKLLLPEPSKPKSS